MNQGTDHQEDQNAMGWCGMKNGPGKAQFRKIAIVAVLVAGISISGCGSSIQQASVSELKAPTFVAHRGGALLYPESSLESFRAVKKSNFPLEMDLRTLVDGTLVPQHDPTVDRNMTGIKGPVEAISRDQWISSSIRNPHGGEPGTPTTWDQVLDEFGGKVVLVPELKRPVANLAGFIDSIDKRNLKSSVIVQSFDYEVCKSLASKGLTVLYLMTNENVSLAEVKSQGISYIGPRHDVSREFLAEAENLGLKVWPWTVNTVEEADELLKAGADGVFTDDPWKLSEGIGQ